jgi:5'-phosphate synthase pdxT subunit
LFNIGVLAIQGDFAKHANIIRKIGHYATEIRTTTQLQQTDALILPGGESTTVLKLLHDSGLFRAIQSYSKHHPIMGTCAGLIILAKKVENLSYPTLNLINITVARNAYGSQRESFVTAISIFLNSKRQNFEAVFIRAPIITSVGEDVEILAQHEDRPVIASSKNILVSTFHPELTDDTAIHQFFVDRFL